MISLAWREAFFANCHTIFLLLAEWKAVGCYKNIGHALDDVIAKAGSNTGISRHYAACENAADQAGILMFGLDERKCWTAENAERVYSKYGSSENCRTNKKGNLRCGLNAAGTMFVYEKKEGNYDYLIICQFNFH